jgi:transcriptional regulator with XRE-family HTH domain
MANSREVLLKKFAEIASRRGGRAELVKKGIPRGSLERYVTGKTVPSLDLIDKLAEGLGTTAWELLKPENVESLKRKDDQDLNAELLQTITVLPSLSKEEIKAVCEFVKALKKNPTHSSKYLEVVYLALDYAPELDPGGLESGELPPKKQGPVYK